MADVVTSKVLVDNAFQHVIHLTNVSDGTGEAAVIKVDKSAIAAAGAYRNPSTGVVTPAAEAVSLDIEAIRWAVQGFPRLTLAWDHTSIETAMVLSGNGFDDFLGARDSREPANSTPLNDGRGAGGTGDIKLTAPAGATTGSYDITLWLRKTNI